MSESGDLEELPSTDILIDGLEEETVQRRISLTESASRVHIEYFEIKDPEPISLYDRYITHCNTRMHPHDMTSYEHKRILLTQIDNWFDRAHFFAGIFTKKDTGWGYLQFKRFRLKYDEFLMFLGMLCLRKEYPFEDLVAKLAVTEAPKSMLELAIQKEKKKKKKVNIPI